MTDSKSKSCLAFLKKVVDEQNNTYHHSIDKRLLVVVFLLFLKKFNLGIKFLKLKLMIDSR